MSTLLRLICNDRAATMVEYATMVTFIAAICIAVVAGFGIAVSGLYATANTAL